MESSLPVTHRGWCQSSSESGAEHGLAENALSLEAALKNVAASSYMLQITMGSPMCMHLS